MGYISDSFFLELAAATKDRELNVKLGYCFRHLSWEKRNVRRMKVRQLMFRHCAHRTLNLLLHLLGFSKEAWLQTLGVILRSKLNLRKHRSIILQRSICNLEKEFIFILFFLTIWSRQTWYCVVHFVAKLFTVNGLRPR